LETALQTDLHGGVDFGRGPLVRRAVAHLAFSD
jgi:hypothetical protein